MVTSKIKKNIFVFGSNLAGRHGRGAALFARRQHGARYGVGIGRSGNAYAIPTKGRDLETLSLEIICLHIINFIDYAKRHPELTFNITKVGCGLAGYTESQILPMFDGSPPNCDFTWWSKEYEDSKL